MLGLLLSLTGAAGQAEPPRTLAKAGAPHWPMRPEAPAGAPNVLVIMTDDVGFASSSTFGGPVPTPTFDALARDGLRYNRFHTTALCSPTRASLLTGRNPHNAEMGTLTNTPTAFAGYTSVIPKATATVAEILRRSGYATAAFGKWHLTPEWEMSEVGPFDRWPTGLGFDYYYGFLAGSTDQFAPALYENHRRIDPPRTPGYILDHDLADRAIGWIRDQQALAPERPFFAYYATGTAHGPHHAPKEWLDRFRGKFDQGWDVMREQSFARQKALGIVPSDTQLTPRPTALPAWLSLSADQKRVASRLMEAYAAALSYADHEMGRVIDSLRANGQLANTLIVYIQGDNGSSGEGGVSGLLDEMSMVDGIQENLDYQLRHIDDIGGSKAYNAYPAGWGWAMNTPFQYYKQVASHLGGVRNGLVLSWPMRIRQKGGLREQFHFISDIAPTILEAAKIPAPDDVDGVRQKPLDGISMVYSFDQPKAPSQRHTQIFAMVQNGGIYHNGWWAGTTPVKAPWDLLKPGKISFSSRNWELYDLDRDFSQAHDLAKNEPVKLAEMQALFWAEAERNNVLPLHDFSEGSANRPSLAAGRTDFIYAPGLTRLPENSAPHMLGRSFAITADVVLPDAPVQGVLATQGGRFGGYAFYVWKGMLVFHYNAIGERQFTIRSKDLLPSGQHKLAARFVADAPVRGTGGKLILTIDGSPVGEGGIGATLKNWISLSEGLDIGHDTITPVNGDYSIDTSSFTGELRSVRIELE